MIYTGLLLITHIITNNNIKPQKAIYKYIINTYLYTLKDHKTTLYSILSRNGQVNKTDKPDTKDLFIYVYRLCPKQLV